MHSRRWSAIRKKILSKGAIPLWVLALGIIGGAAGAGGGAVGPILSGFISGGVGLVVEQSVVIDRENFNTDDILFGIADKLVTFNDEGSSFTVAAEMHTGDDLVIDVPLANRSEFNANMIIKVEVDGLLQHDVEVFWNTLTRSTQPGVSNSEPNPVPLTSTAFQSSDTTPSTTTFPGVAGITAQVSDGTATNSSPGLPDSIPQTSPSTRVNTQPGGGTTASISATSTDSIKTDAQPSGTVAIEAQTANTNVTNDEPDGSASIGAQNSDSNATTTQPSGSASITATSTDTTATTTQPGGSASITATSIDTTATTTQPSGSASITATSTDATATTVQPNNSVSISAISINSLKVNGKPDGSITIVATSTNASATTTQPAGAPASQSTTSTWYIGSFNIDTDGDGDADETVHFVLTDTSAAGVYDRLDLSLGGETFSQGDTTDGTIDSGGDDESITSSDVDIVFGAADVTFTVAFDSDPTADFDDVRLTSKTWYSGNLTLDLDSDGNVNDFVFFALSDADSDGVYETLDLSVDNNTFGQGTTTNGVAAAGDDARVNTSPSDVRLGDFFTFTVAFDDSPESGTSDVTLTSKTWYTGSFTLDLDADNVLDDTVYFALSDSDSDGVYETLDLSVDDNIFGQGGTLTNGVAVTGDDERPVTSPNNIRLGSSLTFSVAFDDSPESGTSDFTLTSKTWYQGSFSPLALDSDGDLNDTVNIILSDTNSDGKYDTLDISQGDTSYGQTTGGSALDDGNVDAGGDDERRTSTSTAIVYGDVDYTFTTAFDSNPGNDDSDVTLTSKTWYTGSITLSLSANDATSTVFFALTDADSNGTFDTLDISQGDTSFGQTTGGSVLDDGNVDAGGDDERRTFSSTAIVYGDVDYTFTTTFVDNPEEGLSDVQLTIQTWFTGSFSLALNNDGNVDDTVNFVLTDTDSDGVFDVMDISQGDTSYGISASDGNVDAGDDEQITSTSTITYGGVNFSFITAFESNPNGGVNDARLTSKTWHTGFFTVALNTDGDVIDIINFALSDTNSDGAFDTMDISQVDTSYGTTASDGNVDPGDDERITAISTIIYGGVNYKFTTAFDNNPEGDTNDARLISKTWYEGSFTLALESDGDVNDIINFALSDTNSDGTFETLGISQNDTSYGTTASDGNVDPGNDERTTATSGTAIIYGAVDYTFTTAFDINPEQGSSDVRLTSKTWYTGNFTIDADADASADDTINFALSDTDSNGTFDTMDVSLGNTTYGQGGQLNDNDITTIND